MKSINHSWLAPRPTEHAFSLRTIPGLAPDYYHICMRSGGLETQADYGACLCEEPLTAALYSLLHLSAHYPVRGLLCELTHLNSLISTDWLEDIFVLVFSFTTKIVIEKCPHLHGSPSYLPRPSSHDPEEAVIAGPNAWAMMSKRNARIPYATWQATVAAITDLAYLSHEGLPTGK
ncbi:hypothetical protein NDU88_001794 [Pleurodeles waltl]|uniref:Uncharacterized protein n=1 Tax=Pleurodeles waltl TaxID=8319 RepID=A0AAV7M0M7_PLEWA|nr:hypothetical protein NDU88_001794 [Pleurodeles waltl]